MGKGARMGVETGLTTPTGAVLLDDFKDQFIITLVRRLAGFNKELRISAREVDDNAGVMLTMETRPETGEFVFIVTRKQ